MEKIACPWCGDVRRDCDDYCCRWDLEAEQACEALAALDLRDEVLESLAATMGGDQ